MVTAIVLVRADVARIPETAEAIVQIPQVSEVYSVTGEFDLVALVRVRAHEELAGVSSALRRHETGHRDGKSEADRSRAGGMECHRIA